MSALAASPLYQSFTKALETLIRRHDRGKTFNDFLTAAICSYHRTNVQTRLQERNGRNEERCMTTISKYTKEEIEIVFKETRGEIDAGFYCFFHYEDIILPIFPMPVKLLCFES